MTETIAGSVEGNYFDKYQSQNRVHRFLVGKFIDNAQTLFQKVSPIDVLEVGCASGGFASMLLTATNDLAQVRYSGIDISRSQIEAARRNHPKADTTFEVASATAIPWLDNSADLVIACEVLEHVGDPKSAIRELARVTRKHALVSVPREPIWRILNCLRGKYIAELANTPGHLQHFSRQRIRQMIAPEFRIVCERWPLPWTMMLLEKTDRNPHSCPDNCSNSCNTNPLHSAGTDDIGVDAQRDQ
ncbi:class I SAM-dependent methyltransferase [Roseiconus lacunae]|uniref:class I SAM-dependent methyltransferase n=1 Tax=Roseiconus lacunae TaxID=2605694 RepID=UPI001E3204E7|nr:class I SAM-dependent methyltransferase [Roseiconus lacunae]MCD0458157.1 class I SAM-dependent methyltransferase [Roseiconus lacunae]